MPAPALAHVSLLARREMISTALIPRETNLARSHEFCANVLKRERSLWDGDNQCGAGLSAEAAIRMANTRIEVDRIAGFERVRVRPDDKLDLAANHIKEFHSGVLVRSLPIANWLELSQERVELAVMGGEIETFEPVGNRSRAWTLGKPDPIFLTHNCHDVTLAFVAKEVVESHTEHHRDPQECGNGGKQSSILQLR